MAESYKGINLSDMKKYIVQTKGKVVSIDKLKKFIDALPTQKKAKGGIVKKKK